MRWRLLDVTADMIGNVVLFVWYSDRSCLFTLVAYVMSRVVSKNALLNFELVD